MDHAPHREDDEPTEEEGIAYSIALAQSIEWPGRLGLRKAIADRDIALAELGLEQFRYSLSSRMKLLGYSLATQQENTAAASEVADRIRSHGAERLRHLHHARATFWVL